MAQAFNAAAIRTVGVAILAGLLSTSSARADGWTPDAVFIEAGHSRRGTDVLGLGLKWQWDWQAVRWGGRFSASGEVSTSRWAADTVSGSRTQAQFALVPLLRYTPGEGRSAWFVEAGIGLSLHRRHYEAEGIRMSTRWNFLDVLAVGRHFGDADEVSLRAVHVSNAGIRKPNPGDELILLRWAHRF
jgi:hypothetical protein